jgi:tetratricopeptide (TPR) repeat protein
MIFRRRDDDGFESTSFMGLLLHPFRALGHAVSDLIKGDDRIGADQTVVSKIVQLLTFPFRLFYGFLVFMVQAWASSRPGFAFIGAIPMIVVSLLFFSALLASDFIYNESTTMGVNEGYLKYHIDVSKDNPEHAHIFAEKLVELKPESNKYKFLLGESYERMGNTLKAIDVITYVAPFERSASPQAHTWMAEYYMRHEDAKDTYTEAERDALASKHLAFAVEQDPANKTVLMNLVSIYLAKCRNLDKNSPEYLQNANQALAHLSEIASGELRTVQQLRAIPMWAELQIEMGNGAAAKQHLEMEIIRLHPIARRQPELFEVWMTMVRCAILAEDHQQALSLVKEGMQLTSNKETKRRMRQLASMIFLKKSDDFTNMSRYEHYRLRLHALSEAIKLNPTDKVVYLKLLDFIGNRQTSPVEQQPDNAVSKAIARVVGDRLDFSGVNEKWLSDAIAVSPAPGVIHALIGMQEISKGNVSDGEKHWRIAEQQFSSTQIVVNNLIDVAAKDRANEFANMQDMITLGIELFPDQPIFYQTRGVYLKNHGRTEEAIQDLLYASEQMPNMVALHQHLADCYAVLGNPEKVAEHEGLLKQKLNQLDEADRKLVEASIQLIN